MKRRALRTAIAKLEAKRRNRRAQPPIIFALYPEEAAGLQIVGLSNHRNEVPRLYGEANLAAFAERARAALGGARIMIAQYGASAAPDAT